MAAVQRHPQLSTPRTQVRDYPPHGNGRDIHALEEEQEDGAGRVRRPEVPAARALWPILFAAVPSLVTTLAVALARGERHHEGLPLSSLDVARGQLAVGVAPFALAAVVGSRLVEFWGKRRWWSAQEAVAQPLYTALWCMALMLAPALVAQAVAGTRGASRFRLWRLAGACLPCLALLAWWAVPAGTEVRRALFYGSSDWWYLALLADPRVFWTRTPVPVVILELLWLRGLSAVLWAKARVLRRRRGL